MKDPEKRLSWPDLLRHPFVADGVLSEDCLHFYHPMNGIFFVHISAKLNN